MATIASRNVAHSTMEKCWPLLKLFKLEIFTFKWIIIKQFKRLRRDAAAAPSRLVFTVYFSNDKSIFSKRLDNC